jgi:hypothetical protein
MFDPIAGGPERARGNPDDWVPVLPVPAGAPAPPTEQKQRGRPSRIETYRDTAGLLLGHVWRFDRGDGGKDFVWLTWCRHTDTGRERWRWKGFPQPRPLYGLDRLAARLDAPVVVCEGEKAADAAAELLPEFVAVTSPGGSKAAGKAGWGPLAGRRVVIWPDADAPGADYADSVARAAHGVAAQSVAVIVPPAGAASGWDAADALAEGWGADRALALVSAARPVPAHRAGQDGSGDAASSQGGRGRRGGEGPPQRDVLATLIDDVELWHAKDHEAFATVPINGHQENWSVRSRMFKAWLRWRYRDKIGSALGGQALEDALLLMEARAEFDGAVHDVFFRVAPTDGAIYLDLGAATWRAVKITAEGWEVVERPPVKFRRSAHMLPLPEPERGGSVELLRPFLNVATEASFRLMVAWLVMALRGRGPYPILVIGGEQGSGKSSAAELLRNLIDPCIAPIRAAPRDERDLVIAARNQHIMALDNMSGVADWLADGLCRLATGGGYATRALTTDWDEVIFDITRPIILNGIPDLTARADLSDRALTVQLRTIDETARRTADAVKAEFSGARAEILGALFDAVSCALRELPHVRLDRLPRMADFALWSTAAERGIGWEPGSILELYRANCEDAVEIVLDADPVAQGLQAIVPNDGDEWSGTATELLAVIEGKVSDAVRKSRSWPHLANQLGGRLRRVMPALRLHGVEIAFAKHGSGNNARRLVFLRRRTTG